MDILPFIQSVLLEGHSAISHSTEAKCYSDHQDWKSNVGAKMPMLLLPPSVLVCDMKEVLRINLCDTSLEVDS